MGPSFGVHIKYYFAYVHSAQTHTQTTPDVRRKKENIIVHMVDEYSIVMARGKVLHSITFLSFSWWMFNT